MKKAANIIYIVLLATLAILVFTTSWVTSPVALLVGIVFALVFGKAYPDFNKLMSRRLLQWSVIGLGFGMNLNSALASGKEGMLFTIVSVVGTLALGWLLGRKLLKVDTETSYLISSGTAICGGSAIAAVGPVIKAQGESMSVALGVVFLLNALGLFIFPAIGDALHMGMKEFGMWAAIAIHDTSSVVGAGGAYDAMHPELIAQEGVSALEVATTVKLTRALWIVVLALVTPFFFCEKLAKEGGNKQPWYKAVPLFIVWFIVAILLNTYLMPHISWGTELSKHVASLAKQFITLSLFFIGASLTKDTLKAVGVKPLLQGVLLWICISLASLAYLISLQ